MPGSVNSLASWTWAGAGIQIGSLQCRKPTTNRKRERQIGNLTHSSENDWFVFSIGTGVTL